MALKEPGVRFVDSVHLLVDFAPNPEVKAAAADAFQPHTWYAASGGMVFRSLNDAEGWEALTTFDGEVVERIRSHPEQPGLVTVVSSAGKGSRLHFSFDAGRDVGRLHPSETRVRHRRRRLEHEGEPADSSDRE